MSFNFGSLQQKADQVLHNADEAIRKWVDFIQAPAGDVNFQYYDKNGNLQTAAFPNRNKVVNDFIANVNSVMSKTFYVDAVNGDDSNPGTSTAPLRTILKATTLVPPGAYCKIIVKGNYTLRNSQEEFEGSNKLVNKYIVLVGDGTNTLDIILDTTSSTFFPIFELFGINTFDKINIIFEDDSSSKFLFYNTGTYDGVSSSLNGRVIISAITNGVEISDTSTTKTYSKFVSNCDIHYNTEVIINDANVYLANASSGAIKAIFSSVVDGAGNAITPPIAGIVRDANGVPRNILSNLIL